MASFSKTFDFNFRRDHQKISYERRDYESVEEKSLLGYAPKNDEKENSGGKDKMISTRLLRQQFRRDMLPL